MARRQKTDEVDKITKHHSSDRMPHGRLYLVRHSDPDKLYPGPYKLLPGPSLSIVGIQKAERLRDFFSGIKVNKIICSPFERALQTATIIGGSALVPVKSKAWSEEAPFEHYQHIEKRVSLWLKGNLPVNGEIILVVGHGATLNAAIELLAPKVFKGAKRDSEGNVVDKAGVWLIEWSSGKIVYCGPSET